MPRALLELSKRDLLHAASKYMWLLATRRPGVVTAENLVHMCRVVNGATTPTSLHATRRRVMARRGESEANQNEDPEKKVPIGTVSGLLH